MASKRAPETEDDLDAWIRERLGLVIPRVSVCPHHDAPFKYVWAAYKQEKDLIVWAPRGGGKTTLGAVATLLDLVHKPSCEVRILGGSLEQSMRMWEQLMPMVERVAGKSVAGKTRARKLRLKNGSGVSVLTQSQRAVRGQRVQRLRCDEVELFDRAVWDAAQLVTRSRAQGEASASKRRGAGGRAIRASIEVLSTLHEPYGLMSEIVAAAADSGREVIKWCMLDVLERCEGRECAGCVLKEDCNGLARGAAGFMRIDDVIRMKQRVGLETWQAEMLCMRPSTKSAVFPEFLAQHINQRDFWDGNDAGVMRSLAVDFGYSNPFVCLWIRHDRSGHVYVMDEVVKSRTALWKHVEVMKTRHPGYAQVACDPSGNGTNAQTSRSDTEVLRAAGFTVHTCGSGIQDGIARIRQALAPAVGEPRLRVHPRCRQFIRSMEGYHYKPGSEDPVKDNIHDHCVDALRYFYMNPMAPAGRPASF